MTRPVSHAPTWRSVEVDAGATSVVQAYLDETPKADLVAARAHRAVREILAENARMRAVLGHCPKAIAVLDEDGNLCGYNREFRALVGGEPQLGEPLARHFAEAERDLLRDVIARAGTDRSAAAVLTTVLGNGAARDVELLVATLPSSDARSIGVVLAGEDRTATLDDEALRRRLYAANRRNAFALGERAVHDELVQVTETLASALDALREDGLDPSARAKLEAARAALGRQAAILKRPDAAASPAGARAEVSSVVHRTRRLATVGPVRARSTIDLQIEGEVHVAMPEPDLLQVLFNVLDNALHAVEDAQRFGWITVAVERRGDRVEIAVHDNGEGIDPARLRSVFEPFETTRAHDGARGLGLAITKALVERAGGAIRVLSEPGAGTTVVLDLPSA